MKNILTVCDRSSVRIVQVTLILPSMLNTRRYFFDLWPRLNLSSCNMYHKKSVHVSHTAEVHSLPNHTGRIFVWHTNHPRKNFWDLNATGQIAFSSSSVSGVEIAVRSFVTLEVRIRFTFRLRDTKASRKQHRSPPNLKEEALKIWRYRQIKIFK